MIQMSEAMRLGAMIEPQTFGSLRGAFGGSCAIGSALRAVGISANDANYSLAIVTCWPWLKERTCKYPGADPAFMGIKPGDDIEVYRAIWLLNDADHWTREQIAEWIASIEPADCEKIHKRTETQQSLVVVS